MILEYVVMVIDSILFIPNKHSYKTLFQILPIYSLEAKMAATETLRCKYPPSHPPLLLHEAGEGSCLTRGDGLLLAADGVRQGGQVDPVPEGGVLGAE